MRQYLSPQDFMQTALGVMWTQQTTVAGVIARALAQAAAEADRIARRPLGLGGRTTLTTSVAVGAVSLAVADARGFDADGTGAVQLDAGNAAEETVGLSGVTVTDWTKGPPYPGTLTLVTPLTQGHASGAVATGLYVERHRARGGSTNAVDFGTLPTQEEQMARAHAPRDMLSDLVRVIFLDAPPVVSVVAIQAVQRWGGTPYRIPTSNIALNAAQGWYRLPVGTFIPQGSDVITTYTGGYGTIPDDVQEAVAILAADALALAYGPVASGLAQDAVGRVKRVATIAGDTSGKSVLRKRAEALLQPYTRMIP